MKHCLFISTAGLLGFLVATCAKAEPQPWTPPNKKCSASSYSVGLDGCYHRNLDAVLQGCAVRNNKCPGNAPPAPAINYITRSPLKVNEQIICDIADAVQKTKESKTGGVDLSSARISISEEFSLVTKDSHGASLEIGIPVFANISVTPSLSAESVTTQTTQTTNSFTYNPALAPGGCKTASRNHWVTSDAVLGPLPQGEQPVQIQEAISFVVTREDSAGLKLNIVPVSIGPQFSSENDKTQKVCILFDFTTPKPGETTKASCSTSGGSSGQPSQ